MAENQSGEVVAAAAPQKAPSVEEVRAAMGVEHPADRHGVGDMTAREMWDMLEQSGGWGFDGTPHAANTTVPSARGNAGDAAPAPDSANVGETPPSPPSGTTPSPKSQDTPTSGESEAETRAASLPSVASAPASAEPALKDATEEQLRAVWQAHHARGSNRFVA